METNTAFKEQLSERSTIVTMVLFGLASAAVAPTVLTSLYELGVPSGPSAAVAAGVLFGLLLSPVMFFALAYQGYTDWRD